MRQKLLIVQLYHSFDNVLVYKKKANSRLISLNMFYLKRKKKKKTFPQDLSAEVEIKCKDLSPTDFIPILKT